jgi:hypothetical protein
MSAACSARLVTPGQISIAAGRRAKLRWRADLMIALEQLSAGVQSSLELGYLRKVESPHGLPKARRQARTKNGTRSAYLDNLYDEFGVAVELDGMAWHPIQDRSLDIRRDNYLARGGIITLRYNWADITSRSCLVAEEIAQVLAQRGWPGTIRSCGPHCQAARP